jgi:hypothetical protein
MSYNNNNPMNKPPAWADTSVQTPSAPITVEQHESELFRPYSTLDEPVLETIMRDVRAVASKLKVVLQPLDRTNYPIYNPYMLVASADALQGSAEQQQQQQQQSSDNNNNNNNNNELSENDRRALNSLKDWDLWGPLVLCLTLAVVLSFRAPTDQASLVFAAVFCTVWVGGTVVTMNCQLLGSHISFFQSLCVLGYSIFPLVLSAMVIGTFKIVVRTWMWLDLIIIAVGFVWAIRVSSIFIGLYIQPERRFLALYPVFFFYTFISWMVLLF